MYKKMLVLLDGSQLAESVFPCAKEIAGRLELDVILLQVYPPAAKEFVPTYQAYIDRAAETIRAQVIKLQESLGAKDIRKPEIRGELKMGYHADEILRYVDENAIDLVMIASHGRSGVKRWTLGSVADKILRAAKVPVWMVHAGVDKAIPFDKWPGQTILVPLPAWDLSASAIPHALMLAKQKGITVNVVLMRVVEPPIMPSYYSPEMSGVPLNWGQLVEQEMARGKKNAQEYLSTIEEQLKMAGISVSSQVLVGRIADEIIGYAKKNPLTVIVMATRGRSGLSRLMYGSIAESVLFGTENPIVLVKPQ